MEWVFLSICWLVILLVRAKKGSKKWLFANSVSCLLIDYSSSLSFCRAGLNAWLCSGLWNQPQIKHLADGFFLIGPTFLLQNLWWRKFLLWTWSTGSGAREREKVVVLQLLIIGGDVFLGVAKVILHQHWEGIPVWTNALRLSWFGEKWVLWVTLCSDGIPELIIAGDTFPQCT